MNRRTKYIIKAILNPMCWIRIKPTNKAWDKKLWNLIENGGVTFVGSHQAIVSGIRVWIENHPYASGTNEMYEVNPRFCSRATAMYLHDVCEKVRFLQILTGPHDAYGDHGISG